MPNLPQLIDTPFMMEPNYFNRLLEIEIDEALIKKADIYMAKTQNQLRKNYTVNNNNAIISIMGPLFQRDNIWSWFFSGSSYDGIREAFNDALENNDVKTIIFEIDSPGGVVAGVFDLVDEIAAARGKKKIIASINEKAYSAAYAIASAADKIYIPRTGGAGSIGVKAIHANYSKFEDRIGVKYTSIFAGARKNDFSPHEPLSDEAYKVIKADVDEIYKIFTSTVAKNRGLDVKAVRAMEAGIYQGKKAVEIGLADSVKTLNTILKKGGKRMSMTLLESIQAAIKDANAEDISKAMSELGYVKKEGMISQNDHTKMLADQKEFHEKSIEIIKKDAKAEGEKIGLESGEKIGMENAAQIVELCGIGNVYNLAIGLIRENSSLDDVKKKILEATTSRQTIQSTVNPLHSGEVNPLLQDAQRRAGEAKQ